MGNKVKYNLKNVHAAKLSKTELLPIMGIAVNLKWLLFRSGLEWKF